MYNAKIISVCFQNVIADKGDSIVHNVFTSWKRYELEWNRIYKKTMYFTATEKKQTDNESLIINGRYNQQELMAKL